jgi:GntR family carbon starvation induced transcriptional regulator
MFSLIESSNVDPTVARSQTSVAYERLRADILAGRLAPSDRLKIADLSTALEVSPGAIREALSRLVPEQLVVSRDQKGFIVAPLSIEDLQDLTELRCEVDGIALRRAVALGDSSWEAAILAAAHLLHRAKQRVSVTDRSLAAEWVMRHAAFHAALVSACNSRRLLGLHTQLYQQSERYRGLTAHMQSDRDVGQEHQSLVDAALDRDADQLVHLVVSHFRKTTALIVDAARRTTSMTDG